MPEAKQKTVRLSLPGWLVRHNDRRTEIFTYACFSLAPVAGSAVSFVVNAGAVGGVLEVARRNVRPSRDSAMIWLAAPLYVYSCAYLVSLIANADPRLRYAWPVAPFLLLPFLYTSWTLSVRATVARAAVFGSMAACFGALVFAAVQFHAFGARAEGGAGNPLVFAEVTTCAALIALAGAFDRRGWPATLLFGAYCAGSIAILYSGSRMAWIALFAGSVAVLWIFRSRMLARKSAVSLVGAAVGVVAVTAVAAKVVPPRIGQLTQEWQAGGESAHPYAPIYIRQELWKLAMESIRAKPFLGYGPQGARRLIRDNFSERGLAPRYTHFHNGLLTAWVEVGIVGPVSLLALLGAAVGIAARAFKRPHGPTETLGAAMLVATVIVYGLNGMTGILVGHDILDSMLVALLCAGAYLAAGRSTLSDARPEPRSTPTE